MKRLLVYLIFALILAGLNNKALSQVIYIQNDCISADLTLYLTDIRPDADAVIYWADTWAKSQVDNDDGVWWQTTTKQQADITVCFTDRRWFADYQIWVADTPIIAKYTNEDFKQFVLTNQQ